MTQSERPISTLEKAINNMYAANPSAPPETSYALTLNEQFAKMGIDFSELIFDTAVAADIDHLIEVISDPQQGIVGTFIGDFVSGLVFNPYSVGVRQRVVALKSWEDNKRRSLFSILTDEEALKRISGVNLKEYNLTGLHDVCFVQVPLRSVFLDQIDPSFYSSEKDGTTYIQTFLIKKESVFGRMAERVSEGHTIPFIAGTSGNYTGKESLTNTYQAAKFCLTQGVPWLHHPVNPETRGSFSIIRIDSNNRITPVRQGNVPFERLMGILRKS